MNRPRRLGALLIALVLILVACGGEDKVGEGIDLDKVKGKGGAAAVGQGNSPSPTAGAPAVTQPSPPPAAPTQKPEQKKPETPTYQIFLINPNPYYQLEGHPPGNVIVVPAGSKLRFINRDDINRQPYVDGLFESPSLPPGGSFEYFANVRTNGQVSIKDRVATFKVGGLEIT